MLAEQIRKFFAYNAWAWERTFAGVHGLDQAAYHAARPLFEGTIHATLVHCLSAEYIWLERCLGRSPESMFTAENFADVEAIEQRWSVVRAGWEKLLAGLEDADLDRQVAYRTTNGTPFALSLKDLCQHVINHATEHRSQITPALYFAGSPTEPLDYLRYCLESQG